MASSNATGAKGDGDGRRGVADGGRGLGRALGHQRRSRRLARTAPGSGGDPHLSACAACTVIVDGAAVRTCLMLTVQAEGASVVTIEGLSSDEALSPLQTAFRKHHVLQCGFCTPGMLTTAHALVTHTVPTLRPLAFQGSSAFELC